MDEVSNKKHPKFFSSLFNLTEHDKKIPTDIELDEKIRELGFYMHYVWPLMRFIIKKKVGFFFKYKWKMATKRTVLVIILVVATYYAWIKVAEPIFIIRENEKKVQEIHEEYNNIQIPDGNLLFMKTISQLESRQNYKITNGQYWGAFQLGNSARKEVGLSDMDLKTFLNDSIIQIWAMNEYMKKNFEYIYKTILDYKIPVKGGVLIGNHLVTQSGFLAASHLVGAFAAIDFIRSDGINVAVDGNGVPLTKYFELNGIELELNR
jgi:hypothetical protein